MSKDHRKKQIVEDKKHKRPQERPPHPDEAPEEQMPGDEEIFPDRHDPGSGDDRGAPSTDFDRPF